MSRRIKTLGALGVFLLLVGLLFLLIKKEEKKILLTPVHSWIVDQTADCGLVLTGGPGRLREGFNLLYRGSVKKLIISGVHPDADLRDIFPQWPYYGSIRETDVILEKRSATTYGNAQQSLALVEAMHCRDVILVTSRLHMYRALQTFRKYFPAQFPIYPRAVIVGSLDPSYLDLSTEAAKSVFYSVWAYPDSTSTSQ